MRKGLIIGIIITIVVVAGFFSLSAFNTNPIGETSEIGNKTITNSTKHYTVSLEEKVGVETPP